MTAHTTGQSIVFVINSLTSGGAERVLVDLIAALEPRLQGFSTHLVLLDREPDRHAAPAFVERHCLDARHRMGASVLGLTRLVRRLRPALCVSFLTRANVAAVVAARLGGVPCILSERVHTSQHLGHGARAALQRALVRATYPFADRIVAVSEAIGEDLVGRYGVAPRRVSVVHNPVDLARIRARALEAPEIPIHGEDVLAIGRLTANKGFHDLIEAFARSGLAGRLVIVGEGPLLADLRAHAVRLGVGARVVLPGYVANPYPLLRAARLYASSSRAEGFPNALVEALAVGCPAVATDCLSGPREILCANPSNGVSLGTYGLLVPVGAVDLLAEGLRLAADPALARGLSERGPERAETFSVASAVDRYWRVIEAALARAPFRWNPARALSAEADAGSAQEGASKQEPRAHRDNGLEA